MKCMGCESESNNILDHESCSVKGTHAIQEVSKKLLIGLADELKQQSISYDGEKIDISVLYDDKGSLKSRQLLDKDKVKSGYTSTQILGVIHKKTLNNPLTKVMSP